MGALRFGRSGQHCPSFCSGHWKGKVQGQWTGIFTAGRKDSFNQEEEGRGNCQRNAASVLVSRDAVTAVPFRLLFQGLPGWSGHVHIQEPFAKTLKPNGPEVNVHLNEIQLIPLFRTLWICKQLQGVSLAGANMVPSRCPAGGVAMRRGPWPLGSHWKRGYAHALEARRPTCPEFHPLSSSANRPSLGLPSWRLSLTSTHRRSPKSPSGRTARV